MPKHSHGRRTAAAVLAAGMIGLGGSALLASPAYAQEASKDPDVAAIDQGINRIKQLLENDKGNQTPPKPDSGQAAPKSGSGQAPPESGSRPVPNPDGRPAPPKAGNQPPSPKEGHQSRSASAPSNGQAAGKSPSKLGADAAKGSSSVPAPPVAKPTSDGAGSRGPSDSGVAAAHHDTKLAETGNDLALPAALAGLALAGGGGALIVARTRRRKKMSE
ncbi:hypothetical protein [Amycolatopsis sp. cmx-11-12]|uniref:hypothetical protein n=1 Tax=Amycolatopsis sp. cmx-11-12 TaxID=2785795 RepID=UPI0039185B5F